MARECRTRRGGRLLIVANRLPVRPVPEAGRIAIQRSVGGLVSALGPLAERIGASWIGWDEGLGDLWRRLAPSRRGVFPFLVSPVRLAAPLREPYYNGFCNATLWPLLHSFLGRTEFNGDWFAAYASANRAFAARVRATARPRDTIWIHDYHLMLVPRMLREAGVRSRILFFLHIPFPSADLFQHLPWRTEILAGLASADAVGVQGPEHVRHLREALDRFLPRGPAAGVASASRPAVRAVPISIDTVRLSRLARSPDVLRRAQSVRDSFHGRHVVLSVERLDYSKGIAERLRAIDLLLETRRDLRGRVSFLQLSVPSREGVRSYDRYRREIDEMVGRINGRFSRPEWVPIRYLFRSLPEAELLAYYRAADVALVTPLKDGMNLVAKEYIAARGGKDGALVLSEFAGSARELRGALLVNPHSAHHVAGAIHAAMEMPAAERRTRMAGMYRHLLRHTVHDWVRKCLAS